MSSQLNEVDIMRVSFDSETRVYEKYPGHFEEMIKEMEDRIKEIDEEKRILLSNIEDLKEALKD